MVSPRKSRKKSACFSNTITEHQPRKQIAAHHSAGPPPTITQRVCNFSGMAIQGTTDYADSTDDN
jgi:hypothetical protein